MGLKLSIQPQVRFTDAALQKLADQAIAGSEAEDESLRIRLFIAGGGCAGLQYGFVPVDVIEETDSVITKTVSITGAAGPLREKKLSIVLDFISLIYFSGADVDYIETPTQAQFVVRNPKVRTSCFCRGAMPTRAGKEERGGE